MIHDAIPANRKAAAREGRGAIATDVVEVLLIEDDPAVLEMYRFKLALDGYQVTVAMDGEEGIAKALEIVPDIIFLDVRLPKKDGFEVLQTLRRDERTAHIPVIILSNYGERELVTRGQTLGALEFLVKADTTPRQLLSGMREWLAE